MKANYHAHTYRCGHATGEMEEYILAAIDAGYDVLGFSDHCPFPNVVQEGIRMKYEQLDDYIAEFNRLKDKYKDKIQLHLGLEVEYMDQYLDYYKYLKEEKGIEYFINGQHCIIENDGFDWYASTPEMIRRRVEDMIKAMKSGLFLYVAHPDIFVKALIIEDPLFDELSDMLIETSIKYDCPLEINEQGLISQRNSCWPPLYPWEPFWEKVSKSKAKVIIGVDAHSPKSFNDVALDTCYEIAEKCNIKLLENLETRIKHN